MAELRFNNGDAISAAALAGLGVYIVLEARQWTYSGPDGPGPGFFPVWYGMALIALSLLVIGARVYRRLNGERSRRLTATEKRDIFHALAVWVAFAVTIALLKVLGFLLAFGMLTYFIVAMIYRRRSSVALTVAAASALGFYLVFTAALGVALPVGVLGF